VSVATVILAAGQGTRMKSDMPKVLHPLAGRPLVAYAVETARVTTATTPVLVVGHGAEAVRKAVGDGAVFVEQAEQRGTGHAVLQAREVLQGQTDLVLVTYADMPLLTVETLRRLVQRQQESAGPITILTLMHENPAVVTKDGDETLGINTRVHLAEAESVLRRRINERWMLAGVTIVDPGTTYIEPDVKVGQDTTIWPNTHLRGETTIAEHCHIGPNTIIADCQIGRRCRVVASVLEQAVMEDDSDIGPFGHLRKGARLCEGAHMGNFGEMKNSTLGPGAKMGHFSYLGDAEVGAGANIGAGTITCNYDGVRKHKTVIGEGAFIGSDSMLVAPVRVGKEAKTGAGSVVTHDVPEGAVAYGVPARVRGGPETREQDES